MLNRTKLYDEHVKLNAKIVDFAGWEMPIQYKSVKEEVIAVRRKVGMFDVSHMGEFIVTGPDLHKFVDYLVTNDVKNTAVGKAVYSPLCREDGTVIDDLIVYKLTESKTLICVNASNIEKDWNWIKSKSNEFNVELNNISNETSLIALQGPESFKILNKIFNNLPDLPYYGVSEYSHNGEKIILARTGYTGEDGFEIFSTHTFAQSLWHQLIEMGVEPCGLAARDILRLEVGYPLYGHELNDSITPLDSGLSWTVKMQKSGFIGKDALSNYKPKFKLIKICCEKGIPREGYEIKNAQGIKVGHVTSGTMSVTLNKGIALAHVDINQFKPDERYFVDIRQKLYDCEIIQKPFVQGGHK